MEQDKRKKNRSRSFGNKKKICSQPETITTTPSSPPSSPIHPPMPGVASAPSSLLSLRHHRFSCLTPPPTGSFISPPVCRACEEEKERKEERKVEKGGDNTFVRCRKCGRVYHMKCLERIASELPPCEGKRRLSIHKNKRLSNISNISNIAKHFKKENERDEYEETIETTPPPARSRTPSPSACVRHLPSSSSKIETLEEKKERKQMEEKEEEAMKEKKNADLEALRQRIEKGGATPFFQRRGTSAGFHSFVALSVVTRTEDLSPLVKDSFQLEFERRNSVDVSAELADEVEKKDKKRGVQLFFDSEDICKLQGGTLQGIVKSVVLSRTTQDAADLLLIYRMFSDPIAFFGEIKCLYSDITSNEVLGYRDIHLRMGKKMDEGGQVVGVGKEEDKEKLKKMNLLRFANFLKKWLGSFFDDFGKNPPLLSDLNEFLLFLKQNNPKIYQNLSSVHQKRMSSFSTPPHLSSSSSFPRPSPLFPNLPPASPPTRNTTPPPPPPRPPRSPSSKHSSPPPPQPRSPNPLVSSSPSLPSSSPPPPLNPLASSTPPSLSASLPPFPHSPPTSPSLLPTPLPPPSLPSPASPCPSPPSPTPSSPSLPPTVLLSFKARDIARQMTILDQKLYNNIQPWEILSTKSWGAPGKKGGGGEGGNVKKLVEHFNRVSGGVSWGILGGGKVEGRGKVMGKWVKVACCCLDLNNFNGAMTIYAGLNQMSVFRLKHTIAALCDEDKKKMQRLDELLAPHAGYSKLKSKISGSVPPCVPYLGLYLSDITYILDGLPSKLEGSGFINFQKFQTCANLVKQIQLFQNSKHNFEPDGNILAYFDSLTAKTDDDLYELSLQCEPRGK